MEFRPRMTLYTVRGVKAYLLQVCPVVEQVVRGLEVEALLHLGVRAYRQLDQAHGAHHRVFPYATHPQHQLRPHGRPTGRVFSLVWERD